MRVPGSKTKFQIVTPEMKLKFKAANADEREQWLQALSKEIEVAVNDEVNVMDFGGLQEEAVNTTSK